MRIIYVFVEKSRVKWRIWGIFIMEIGKLSCFLLFVGKEILFSKLFLENRLVFEGFDVVLIDVSIV